MMLDPKKCPHSDLMESFRDQDKDTGEWVVIYYRCVDCGKQIDAKNVNTVPPSKSYKRVFAIQDE